MLSMDALMYAMNAVDALVYAMYAMDAPMYAMYAMDTPRARAHDGVHSRTCAFMRVHFNPHLNVTITSGWCRNLLSTMAEEHDIQILLSAPIRAISGVLESP